MLLIYDIKEFKETHLVSLSNTIVWYLSHFLFKKKICIEVQIKEIYLVNNVQKDH